MQLSSSNLLLNALSPNRCEVVRRRAQFKLQGAEKRRHVVEGLIIAQRNMDKVVSTIRSTSDSAAAAQKLQQDFFLSPEQVKPTSVTPCSSVPQELV